MSDPRTVYAINGTRVTTDAEGWATVREVPTFYLLADIQGIMSEDAAERVARDVIGPDAHVRAYTLTTDDLAGWEDDR